MWDWLRHLKNGLTRSLPPEPLSASSGQRAPRLHLGNLRPLLRRHWMKGLAGLAVILVYTLLSLPQPLLYRLLIDDVMLARRLNWLLPVLLLMGLVKLFSAASGMAQQYLFSRFEQSVMLDLQHNLLEHALHLPKSFFDDKATGYLLARLSSDVQGVRWFFSGEVVYLIDSLFRFVGGVALVFYLEWRLGLVTLVVLPLLVFSTRYFGQRLHILSHHSMERSAGVLQRLQETLASLPLIKAFASERRERERVLAEVAASQQLELEQNAVGAAAGLVLTLVPGIAAGVALAAGAYWVIQGVWTVGSLLAFQSYLGYVFGPAMSLSNANLQFQRARGALERISAIFDILPEETRQDGRQVQRLRGELHFEQVSFSYNGSESVLEQVSFHVQPGEHVAIAGPSGVGKTTLVSLILAFYRPTGGRIHFDGLPLEAYDLSSLRRRIGYVAQSTLLLSGTIRANLEYGNPGASAGQIEQAARVAGIHDFIQSLPDGYEARVGERGVNLSEGQKQRLSVARALVKDPDILIFDEPTSALDGLVERSIFEALPAAVQHKTLIVVAHRPTTLRAAGRVLLFNEKRLVAEGTHAALLAGNAYYRSFFE